MTDLKNGRGKYWKKTAVFVTLLVGVFFSVMQSNGRGDKRNEEAVSTGSAGENTVLVGGMPVGIYMETDGILVLEMCIRDRSGESVCHRRGQGAA